jgi:biopolymer transport protein ExbB/TolQ
MFELLPNLLASGAILLLAISLWAAIARNNRRLAAERARGDELQQQLELARQSIRGLTTGAVGVDRRVGKLEARERLLSERQETYEIQQADEQPYGHAIRMVQQGAGVGRLVQELELSESEADLIVRLHGQRDSA